MKYLLLFALMAVGTSLSNESFASASMNTCNNATNECRANVIRIYNAGNYGYVVLAGHLVPTICTNANWGYYWVLDLTDVSDRARYATAITAYTTNQPVELRTFDTTCKAVTVAIGND